MTEVDVTVTTLPDSVIVEISVIVLAGWVMVVSNVAVDTIVLSSTMVVGAGTRLVKMTSEVATDTMVEAGITEVVVTVVMLPDSVIVSVSVIVLAG